MRLQTRTRVLDAMRADDQVDCLQFLTTGCRLEVRSTALGFANSPSDGDAHPPRIDKLASERPMSIQVPLDTLPNQGTIAFRIRLPHPDWASNSLSYKLPTITSPVLTLEGVKHGDGTLELHVIGLFKKWLIARHRTDPSWDQDLRTVITWKDSVITLYINAVKIAESDVTQLAEGDYDPIPAAADLLGKDWLESELKNLHEARPDVITYNHPFVEFYQAYLAMAASERPRMIAFPYYATLSRIMLAAKSISGFERTMPDLRRPDGFRDTISELCLAHYLSTSGFSVEFVDPGGSVAGQKNADLSGRLPSNTLFRAECKHLQASNDLLAQARVRWPGISTRIVKLLKRRKLSVFVYGLFKSLPQEEAVQHLLSEIEGASNEATPAWTLVRENEWFQLWLKLHNAECTYESVEAQMPECSDMNRLHAWVEAQSNGKEFRDIRVVGLELDVPRISLVNFENRLKKASSQLPKDGVGIVGIEIHPPAGQADVDIYLDWLRNQFARGNHGRVNRAYIFWLREDVDERIVAGHRYVNPTARMEFAVLDNLRARTPAAF
jgi:hypothetical protein